MKASVPVALESRQRMRSLLAVLLLSEILLEKVMTFSSPNEHRWMLVTFGRFDSFLGGRWWGLWECFDCLGFDIFFELDRQGLLRPAHILHRPLDYSKLCSYLTPIFNRRSHKWIQI